MSFSESKNQFLGHLVSATGIEPDPDRIKAITELNYPINTKDLRSFLGIAGYYRRFIPNFAKICGCLYDLTKLNSVYIFQDKHKKAFVHIKTLLASAPILCHPDYNYPFILQTDACENGLEAVLIQRINGVEKFIQ
jgi:hypothetical protein